MRKRTGALMMAAVAACVAFTAYAAEQSSLTESILTLPAEEQVQAYRSMAEFGPTRSLSTGDQHFVFTDNLTDLAAVRFEVAGAPTDIEAYMTRDRVAGLGVDRSVIVRASRGPERGREGAVERARITGVLGQGHRLAFARDIVGDRDHDRASTGQVSVCMTLSSGSN